MVGETDTVAKDSKEGTVGMRVERVEESSAFTDVTGAAVVVTEVALLAVVVGQGLDEISAWLGGLLD